MSPELLPIALQSRGANQRVRRYNPVPHEGFKSGIQSCQQDDSKSHQTLWGGADPTPFKITVDQVYDAIKVQDFISHPRPLPPNLKGPGAGEYCAFHDGM